MLVLRLLTMPSTSALDALLFSAEVDWGGASNPLLAALPEKEQADVLSHNADVLAQSFPSCRPDVLKPLILQTARRGYSLNPGLVLTNSWAVGAAFRMPGGQVLGAISIAAIDSRMGPDRQAELGAALLEETAKIEARLAKAFALQNSSALAPNRHFSSAGSKG